MTPQDYLCFLLRLPSNAGERCEVDERWNIHLPEFMIENSGWGRMGNVGKSEKEEDERCLKNWETLDQDVMWSEEWK